MPVAEDEGAAAIVLAAGASSRLGQPKQFVGFAGEPLVRRAARLALEAGAAPVYVISRAEQAHRVAQALDGLGARVLDNPNAAQGMGSSLRRGMDAILRLAPLPARVLLMVCDQPRLTAESLRVLLTAPHPGGVAAAGYAGRVGVPAVFDQQHFAVLSRVQGDQGARDLLRTLAVHAVAMPEAAADLDTPEDLRALTGSASTAEAGTLETDRS